MENRTRVSTEKARKWNTDRNGKKRVFAGLKISIQINLIIWPKIQIHKNPLFAWLIRVPFPA